jgi:phytoene dehydrogenase-like protein
MTYLLRSCVSPSGNGALVNCLTAAFQHYGGDLLIETPVEAIDNGTVTAAGRQYEAPIIVSNLGPPLTYELMDRPMERSWSTGKRTIMTADVVLDRPLRWDQPELDRAPRVYLIWDDWTSYKDWITSAGLETFFGHLELTQFHNIYGENDRGQVGLRVRFGSGPRFAS